ncbi:hypothetical protein QYM36_018357 [Artemia franciscana]|uniref:DUF4371 domain-containing protein n=1 Tax=Artemia franciscana TaxID=6661 RepID=A0AA88KRL1_ARTSF|nr:hypothetical protein QYM36_018357 [Artemia franciscana]
MFKAIETEAAESVASCLSKEREKEILENRQYVKALLKTTALLGRQGLAFRGHDEEESSANQGNFVETVHLLTEINPDLMKNSRKAYGHYMSHDATKNELRKMRDDEYFRVLYGKSKEMAINVGADLSETSALSSAIPVKSKRVQKISGRLRDYLTTTTIGKHNIDSESTTTEDKMRRVLRVQLPVLEATRCLNPKSKDFMDSDLLLVIATYFDQAGIDTMQLKCQALIARAFVSQLPQKPANALDVFERLGGLKEADSELLKVVRVVLTLPLTTREGVNLVLNSFARKPLLSFTPISSHLLTARIGSKHRKVTVLTCYAPTNEAENEDKDYFYAVLSFMFSSVSPNDYLTVIGDFNAVVANSSDLYDAAVEPLTVDALNENREQLFHHPRPISH